MKIIICILLSGLAVLSMNITATDAQEPDAAGLVKDIRLKGAKAVMAELIDDNKWTAFDKVCDKVETGENEWLEVARLLAPGSDAASAESLIYSVARALPKAPRRVLSLVAATEYDPKAGFTVDMICISPFIEPEPGVSERYLIDTEKALESTDTSDSPRLDTLRLKCLDNIRKIIGYAKKQGIWSPAE